MATLSTPRRVLVAYGVSVLGLLFSLLVANVLPTRVADPSDPTCKLDCFPQLNMVKVVVILLGLLVAFIGILVGAFRSYLAQS